MQNWNFTLAERVNDRLILMHLAYAAAIRSPLAVLEIAINAPRAARFRQHRRDDGQISLFGLPYCLEHPGRHIDFQSARLLVELPKRPLIASQAQTRVGVLLKLTPHAKIAPVRTIALLSEPVFWSSQAARMS